MKIVFKYASLLVLLVMSVEPTILVAEEVPGTGLSLFFESANVSVQGRRVSLLKVPVVDKNGSTSYINAEFVFTLDEENQLVFERIGTIAPVNPTNSFNFIQGTYEGMENGTYSVGINGDSERPEGSLNSKTNYNYDISATWIGGPVEGHTLLSGVTNIEGLPFPEGYAYGRWGADHPSNEDFDSDNGWRDGYLIGVKQTGTNLAFFLFEDSEGIHSYPVNSGSIRLSVDKN